MEVADVMEASTDLRAMPSRDAASLSGVTGNPSILWVGRLTPNKDPMTMIEGFSQFLDVYPNAALSLVYSTDAMRAAVHERIQRDPRLAARVRMVGTVAASQMAAYYSAADIYVSDSHREGSGYAAIEAMACGAPVVTSRTGAAPEVAGGAAMLVDPFDVGDIEAGLERATIPEERRQLRELGFRRARQFDWRTAAEATIEAYRRAK